MSIVKSVISDTIQNVQDNETSSAAVETIQTDEIEKSFQSDMIVEPNETLLNIINNNGNSHQHLYLETTTAATSHSHDPINDLPTNENETHVEMMSLSSPILVSTRPSQSTTDTAATTAMMIDALNEESSSTTSRRRKSSESRRLILRIKKQNNGEHSATTVEEVDEAERQLTSMMQNFSADSDMSEEEEENEEDKEVNDHRKLKSAENVSNSVDNLAAAATTINASSCKDAASRYASIIKPCWVRIVRLSAKELAGVSVGKSKRTTKTDEDEINSDDAQDAEIDRLVNINSILNPKTSNKSQSQSIFKILFVLLCVFVCFRANFL